MPNFSSSKLSTISFLISVKFSPLSFASFKRVV
nr:MAG TPA: hypothetical protein [Caudoviricetes sp.]